MPDGRGVGSPGGINSLAVVPAAGPVLFSLLVLLVDLRQPGLPPDLRQYFF